MGRTLALVLSLVAGCALAQPNGALPPPQEAAFSVLPQVYLSMHPKNIEAQLEQRGSHLRLFAGFCGWAPRQLEAQIDAATVVAAR